MTTLLCTTCGQEFDRPTRKIRRGTVRYFCSVACVRSRPGKPKPTPRRRGRALATATCDACGSVFERGAAFLRRAKHHFCSNACVAAYWRGAGNPAWRGEAALPDSGRTRANLWFAPEPCGACGASPDQTRIHRHHVDRNPLNNTPSNIRFLCAVCHRRLHAALVTHCKNGHPYDDANTDITANGRRSCRTCRREYGRRGRRSATRQEMPA